jgi:DNA-binding response OmpR family regulator
MIIWKGFLMATTETSKATILVVDDEQEILRLVEFFLKREGYTVVKAASPLEAIAVFDECGAGIDVLLTDYSMPGMNGLELVESLRKHRPTLPVVFMSGRIDVEQEIADRNCVCIRKPLSFADLLGTIEGASWRNSRQGVA